MRNATGKVVYDRRFNTSALLANYYGSNVDFAGRIRWNPQVQTLMAQAVSITTAFADGKGQHPVVVLNPMTPAICHCPHLVLWTP